MFFPNAGVEVNPALLVLLGVMTGILSGFFGVGGGFLITGGLIVFGVPPIFAVGTGLSAIMGSALINALKHRKFGHVDFKLGTLLVAGAVPAMFLAERLNSQLESWDVAGPVIRSTYIVFLAAVASFILYDYVKTTRRSASRGEEVSTFRLVQRVQSLRIPPHSIWLPGRAPLPTYIWLSASRILRISIWVPVSIGFGAGFLAGLLGAGGGFVLMPVLIFVVGIPTAIAIGTGLFQIVITGSVGTLLYSLSNHVDLLMSLIMLGAASAGSQLGVTATAFVDAARIRSLFSLTILSGSVAIALTQVAESGAGPEGLSIVASALLLGGAGAMCVTIAALLAAGRGKTRERAPSRVGTEEEL